MNSSNKIGFSADVRFKSTISCCYHCTVCLKFSDNQCFYRNNHVFQWISKMRYLSVALLVVILDQQQDIVPVYHLQTV